MEDNKECFIISPIGEEGSDRRQHADDVLELVIEEPLEECGYTPTRADDMDEPGDITRQIVQKIYDAPLVLADLTFENANVFYELAIRHARDKPVILICESGEDLPFDIQSSRTVFYDLNDVRKNSEAQDQISSQIEHIEEKGSYGNVITNAIELKMLKESDDPKKQAFGELRADINDLQSSVTSLEGTVRKELKRENRPWEDSQTSIKLFGDAFNPTKSKVVELAQENALMGNPEVRKLIRHVDKESIADLSDGEHTYVGEGYELIIDVEGGELVGLEANPIDG